MGMGKTAIGGDDNATTKRSVGDATSYKGTVGKDQMDGVGLDKPATPPLRMTDNILEAHGRDVSNKSIDVDGWAGEDVPYKGMADETPYGGGSGMKGSQVSKGRRG